MTLPTFNEEKTLWQKGYSYVIGVDEVGRGAFAGPVVVGAVIFRPDTICTEKINDSKLLTPTKREKLDTYIRSCALSCAIAEESVTTINALGIGKATQKAFQRVVATISEHIRKISSPSEFANSTFLLIDGYGIHVEGIEKKNQQAIIKGDQKSLTIASASIIAKVYRDNLMTSLSKEYNKYDFALHKGYGTAKHQEAIRKYGLSNLHRTSFNLQKFTM